MSIKKNFFAIMSTPRSPQSLSRDYEMLSPRCGDFYREFNSSTVPSFVYTLLVSKLIHLINRKPDYRNYGRLELTSDAVIHYNQKQIVAFLQLIFNRDDADSTVLFLTGHGTPKGDLVLFTPEGEALLNYQTVLDCWANRTSKHRNRELLIICDFCFSGSWVLANQVPDIFIQAACSDKERARDIRMGEASVGSVFLHNLLMVNETTDCFLVGAQQSPMCTLLKPDQADRVRNVFSMRNLFRSWDDMLGVFGSQKVRLFNRDQIIYDGRAPPVERERVEDKKKGGNPRPVLNSNIKMRLEVARRLFRMFDKDQGGFLDETEIPALIAETYKSMGMNNFVPSKDDVQSWLAMGDTNRDGKVSLEEYEEVVLNSLKKAGIKLD